MWKVWTTQLCEDSVKRYVLNAMWILAWTQGGLPFVDEGLHRPDNLRRGGR